MNLKNMGLLSMGAKVAFQVYSVPWKHLHFSSRNLSEDHEWEDE